VCKHMNCNQLLFPYEAFFSVSASSFVELIVFMFTMSVWHLCLPHNDLQALSRLIHRAPFERRMENVSIMGDENSFMMVGKIFIGDTCVAFLRNKDWAEITRYGICKLNYKYLKFLGVFKFQIKFFLHNLKLLSFNFNFTSKFSTYS